MNGRDVSQLAHEEAVAEFLSATEPILVEVKRRNDPSQQLPSNARPSSDWQNIEPPDQTASPDLTTKLPTTNPKSSKLQTSFSVACQTEPICDFSCGDYVDGRRCVDSATTANQVLVAPFMLDSPANSCDDDMLACHLFNDCLNPSIDIEVIDNSSIIIHVIFTIHFKFRR